MTKASFFRKLVNLGIDITMICWEESLRDDVFCIFENNGKWKVYYQERGNKYDIMYFKSESDALVYLLNKLT